MPHEDRRLRSRRYKQAAQRSAPPGPDHDPAVATRAGSSRVIDKNSRRTVRLGAHGVPRQAAADLDPARKSGFQRGEDTEELHSYNRASGDIAKEGAGFRARMRTNPAATMNPAADDAVISTKLPPA